MLEDVLMRPVNNIKIAIGVPCSFPFVPISFVNSFILMDKPNFQYITADNGPIDTLRNDIVETAQRIEATHLLFMDVDQIYPVDTITKLLKHRLPVVAAKVNRRYPPFDPIMLKITDAGYQPIDDYVPGSLVSVDATGTGCILYDMEVFKKIPRPWYRFQKHPETGLVIGEDIGLCQELKKLDYEIFVDTSIEVGHLATMIVNQKTHELYKAMKCGQQLKREAIGVSDK